MKINFKTYTLTEGNSYGIAHVEDLEIEAFIRAIERIKKLRAVQKLDGANLRMGLDSKGEVFTSREQKGGKRFYTQKDFPNTSAYDGFRAAHEVIKKIETEIKAILSPGEAVNMEVIYGAQPNTVFYGKDGMNYLAFLEILPGDDPSIEPDQRKVERLESLLRDKTITVKTVASDTTDGDLISRNPVLSDWRLTVSDRVSKNDIEALDFSEELSRLKSYLKQNNKVAEKLGKDLTNFEVMKDRSPKLADERKVIGDTIMNEFKLPIKKRLLKIVANQKPSLRGEIDDEGAYHGIEGIIFTDPSTGEKFKVVDRDLFTKVNQFNYQVRKGIATRIMTADPDMPIDSRGGLVGEARLRSIHLFGLENAELPSQTKKVLAKFEGETREETVGNIADSLHQLNFQAIKRKIQAIYASTLDDVEDSLLSFKQNADGYELELDDGKKVKYTKEIKRRTLLVFAEAKRELRKILKDVKSTDDLYSLIDIMFDKQLDQIHSGEVE